MPEPKIWKVTIEQGSTGVTFRPTPQSVNLGDSVFWFNNTTKPHQPAPDGGTADQWVSQPIPPHSQSSQVVFDTVPAGQTSVSFSYHCAVDSTSPTEKGVITVNVTN